MSGRQKASLNPSIAFGGDGRVNRGDAANKEAERMRKKHTEGDEASFIWKQEYPNILEPHHWGSYDITKTGLRAKGWRYSGQYGWNKRKPDPKAVEWFAEWAQNNGHEVLNV